MNNIWKLFAINPWNFQATEEIFVNMYMILALNGLLCAIIALLIRGKNNEVKKSAAYIPMLFALILLNLSFSIPVFR